MVPAHLYKISVLQHPSVLTKKLLPAIALPVSHMHASRVVYSQEHACQGMDVQQHTEMPVFPEKDISRSAVTMPPSLMSCPALIVRWRSSCCVASHAPFRSEDATSGTSSPTCILYVLCCYF